MKITAATVTFALIACLAVSTCAAWPSSGRPCQHKFQHRDPYRPFHHRTPFFHFPDFFHVHQFAAPAEELPDQEAASDEVAELSDRDVSFVPSVDIKEEDASVSVLVELPGMTVNDITVEVKDDTLVISGTREHRKEESGARWHLVERSSGFFRRSFAVDPEEFDADAISAKYDEGVLEVEIPKRTPAIEEPKKSNRIEIVHYDDDDS